MSHSTIGDLPSFDANLAEVFEDENSSQFKDSEFLLGIGDEGQSFASVQFPAEVPVAVASNSRDFANQWTLNDASSSYCRPITPLSFSLSSTSPHFVNGSFKRNGEKYHLKVGYEQTLKLGMGCEKFSGTVSLFIRRKEYATRPFTGEGSCVTYDDKGSNYKLWPFRASTLKNRGVSYNPMGLHFCVDVVLDNEDEIHLTFLKLSTHITDDERINGGLRQKKAKEMVLVLQSKLDDQAQMEIPIQVQAGFGQINPIQIVAEDRYVQPQSQRQVVKRAREQAVVKTEPSAVDDDAEAVPKLPKVEVLVNVPAAEVTQQDQIQLICEKLQNSSPEITQAVFTLLFTPMPLFNGGTGNFQ